MKQTIRALLILCGVALYHVTVAIGQTTASASAAGPPPQKGTFYDLPVKQYVVIDLSGSVQGDKDVDRVAIGNDGQVAFSYWGGDTDYEVTLWKSGGIIDGPKQTGSTYSYKYYDDSQPPRQITAQIKAHKGVDILRINSRGNIAFGGGCAFWEFGKTAVFDVTNPISAPNGDPISGTAMHLGENNFAAYISGSTIMSGAGGHIIWSDSILRCDNGGIADPGLPFSRSAWIAAISPPLFPQVAVISNNNGQSWTHIALEGTHSPTSINDSGHVLIPCDPGWFYYNGQNAVKINEKVTQLYQFQLTLYAPWRIFDTDSMLYDGVYLDDPVLKNWKYGYFLVDASTTSSTEKWPVSRLGIGKGWAADTVSSLPADGQTWPDLLASNTDGLIVAKGYKILNEAGALIPTAQQHVHALLLFQSDLAVDANRDGIIKFTGNARSNNPTIKAAPQDTTSKDTPFRFWCNDDDDSNNEDHPDSSQKDGKIDDQIQSLRDLEDFTRLHIYLGALQEAVANNIIQVGLEWRDVPQGSSPSIKIYKAAELDGGDEYLRNSDGSNIWPERQNGSAENKVTLKKIAAGDTSFRFPQSFWQTGNYGLTAFSADHPNRYLIFEGIDEGKGRLVLTFWKGTTPLGEGGSVWLDIKQIKKMYQRWDSATAHPWAADQFEAPPDEQKKDAIIFVHGWKMSPTGAGNFAETIFKRLWNRGFKGRFVAYHWDTYWFDSWKWVNNLAGADIGAALAHYNDSEYIAWQGAASSLKTYVNNLQFENKNIVAHSMGNIIVGEALKEGMTVKNYAMLNAAVPAACYDEDEGRIKQTTQYTHTATLFGVSNELTMWDYSSPDGDIDSFTRNLAYRGTLKDIGNNATLINFFLPNDFATSVAWEINNDITKPPSVGAPLSAGFEYGPNLSSGHKLYKYSVLTGLTDHYITYKPEAMAYACRTWGKAAGAFGATQGAIAPNSNVDMSDSEKVGGGESGFDREHSAEFNFRIQQTTPFFNTLLDQLKIKRNNP